MSARLAPLALLLATGALLGVSTNLAKVAASLGLAPLPFLAWSVAGAAVALTALGALRGSLAPITPRTVEYFLLAALVSLAAPNLLFFSAVPHVGAGFVALAIACSPLFTYLGALALRLEGLQAMRAGGVALALAGTSVIALHKLLAPDAPTLWIAASLLGSVLLACGNIYRSLRWPPGARPDALAPGMLAGAALLLFALGLLPSLSLAVPLDRPGPALLVLAQTATFSAQYLLYFQLQKRGGPVYLSLLGSVGAVVGVPAAILLLGEAPPGGLLPGAALIALGVALLTFGAARPSPRADVR
jgi:drug/metabolite transporter (DMT)-like permease